MQCQVSEMTWEVEYGSKVERLSGLSDVCTGYLMAPITSSNTIQSMAALQLLESKLMTLSVALMVLWEEMDAFMRSHRELAEY